MINSKLFQLYQDHWDSLFRELKHINRNPEFTINPANPLLLKVGDEKAYTEADIRVMIFGQEPNTWGGYLRDNVAEVQLIYKDFFLTNYCFDTYKRPFWNGVNQLRHLFWNQYPKAKVEFYWNDIIKVGMANDKGMPPHNIQQIELKHFKVIQQEIEILKPDVIIFLSGPDYDWFIKQQIGEINFNAIEGYSARQMARLEIPNVKTAIRTYHPGYLKRSSNTDGYFNSIMNEINQSL